MYNIPRSPSLWTQTVFTPVTQNPNDREEKGDENHPDPDIKSECKSNRDNGEDIDGSGSEEDEDDVYLRNFDVRQPIPSKPGCQPKSLLPMVPKLKSPLNNKFNSLADLSEGNAFMGGDESTSRNPKPLKQIWVAVIWNIPVNFTGILQAPETSTPPIERAWDDVIGKREEME